MNKSRGLGGVRSYGFSVRGEGQSVRHRGHHIVSISTCVDGGNSPTVEGPSPLTSYVSYPRVVCSDPTLGSRLSVIDTLESVPYVKGRYKDEEVDILLLFHLGWSLYESPN